MIKFRGIPLEDVSEMRCVNFDGDFVYGYYIKNGDGALIVGDKTKELDDVGLSRWFANVVPETVGQFTGLKDVNGKEIYVGDIVKVVWQYWGQLGNRYEVKFKKGAFYVGHTLSSEISPSVSVIGNIHNNPELLEVDK